MMELLKTVAMLIGLAAFMAVVFSLIVIALNWALP